MTLRPIVIAILFIAFFLSCKKSINKQPPLITTTELVAPGDLSIIAGGRIYEEGGDAITEVGVCWSKTDNAPTLDDQSMRGSQKNGIFSCKIQSLDPFTTYFVCAYAINKYGTTYGTTERINSGAPPQPPTLQTMSLLKMTTSAISVVGKITSPLNLITESGVCWNTTGNPSINDNRQKSSTFSSTGFTCTVEGLQPNSLVFAKTYAITAGGTSYGAQIVVRTYYSTFNDHEGNTYFTTLINGKEWMAENLRCTSFTNGTKIQKITDNFSWSSTNYSPAYCTISSSGTATANEGFFYNTAVTSNSNSIAPSGWHLPTKTEFDNLIGSLNSSQNAANCMLRPTPGMWSEFYTPTELTAFDAKLQGWRTYGGYYSSNGIYSNYAAAGSFIMSIYFVGTPYTTYSVPGDGSCIRLVKD